MRPKALYTDTWIYNVFGRNYTQIHVYIMSLVAMQLKKKRKKKELRCDQRHYAHIHVYIMSLVAMQLFFLSFFVELRPDIMHTYTECVYNVYGRNTVAGRILFIILNQAAGQIKFGRGPDLAHRPDFGHACATVMEEATMAMEEAATAKAPH